MIIKAAKSFVGICSMNVGEIKDIPDEVATDLVSTGLAVAIEAEKPVVKEEKPKAPKKTTTKKPAAKRTTKKTSK